MWLKTERSKINSSFDVYYQKIDTTDKAWKSISDLIENELESHFLDNEESLAGIKFNIEIVDTLPDDIHTDED